MQVDSAVLTKCFQSCSCSLKDADVFEGLVDNDLPVSKNFFAMYLAHERANDLLAYSMGLQPSN